MKRSLRKNRVDAIAIMLKLQNDLDDSRTKELRSRAETRHALTLLAVRKGLNKKFS